MKINDLKNKSILILGLGREGMSNLKFIAKYLPGKKVSVADKILKENLPDEIIENKYFGNDYLKAVLDFDVILKSPGISPHQTYLEEVFQYGKVTSGTELFMSEVKGQVIGVTGTKGKSTTASLIYEVLKNGGKDVELVGNIGIPVLDYLEKDSPDKIFVFEMSSHQLMDLKVSPQTAVLTNIYPEHLDYYNDFAEYVLAKANITRYQNGKDILIYNQADPEIQKIAQSTLAQKITYSSCTWEEVVKREDVPLIGEFNIQNIIPAILIGRLFNIPVEKIGEAIKNFKTLPHRLESIGMFNGITFYDDSISTIPQAAVAALSALGEEVETLICGGYDRDIDFSILGEALKNSKVKNLILFPDTGVKIWQAVGSNNNLKKFEVESMDEAVKIAFENTTQGKICLLSPASSSFNLFKNYEDRGNKFREAILKFAKVSLPDHE